MHRIHVREVDITTLRVDAVVNAANERMLGGGGVDGAIHRAAGPGLLEECRGAPEVRPGVRCPTGEARITGGHGLQASHVIHTVGPVYHGGDQGEAEFLASCYRESLRLLRERGLVSIAFPAISCGVYGYPIADAARLAMGVVRDCLSRDAIIEEVVFAAFGDEVAAALRNALEERS
jgi:O-acetyl-ADP-ribose deacetylase (regulator of RNase III)